MFVSLVRFNFEKALVPGGKGNSNAGKDGYLIVGEKKVGHSTKKNVWEHIMHHVIVPSKIPLGGPLKPELVAQ